MIANRLRLIVSAFACVSLLYAPALAKDRPAVGLALSGGAARGFAHIGVLKVLEEAGLTPDYISGSSMGAIVGGMYAAGYSASEIESLKQDQREADEHAKAFFEKKFPKK